jgi:hypothetical protein
LGAVLLTHRAGVIPRAHRVEGLKTELLLRTVE